MKRYFVSYNYSGPNTTGFGRCEVRLSRPILTADDIKNVERSILADSPELAGTIIVIISWQEFPEARPTLSKSQAAKMRGLALHYGTAENEAAHAGAQMAEENQRLRDQLSMAKKNLLAYINELANPPA